MTIKIQLRNNDELALDVLPTDTVGNLKKQIETVHVHELNLHPLGFT